MQPLTTGSIDMVVGDASLNNVPNREMPALFAELRRVTHPESLFSLKQIVFPDKDSEKYRFSRLLENYRSRQLSSEEFRVLVRFYSFKDRFFDHAEHSLAGGEVYREIDKIRQLGELSEEEYRIFQATRGDIVHTVYSLSKQKALFEKMLGPCRVQRPSSSIVYEVFPVFYIRQET